MSHLSILFQDETGASPADAVPAAAAETESKTASVGLVHAGVELKNRLSTLAETDASFELRIGTFGDLKMAHPLLLPGTVQTAPVSTAVESKKRKTTSSAADKKSKDDFYKGTTENPNALPPVARMFYDQTASIPRVIHQQAVADGSVTPLTGDQIAQKYVGSRLLDLPLSDADHENELLVQAGMRTMPGGMRIEVPACSLGPKCEGVSKKIPGHPTGHVLGMYMSASDWAVFKSGRAPVFERGPCLLCIRLSVYAKIIAIRAWSKSTTVKPDYGFQLFANPTSGPASYDGNQVLMPSTSTWQGISAPIVRHDRSMLKWAQNADTGLWYIDQSRIINRPGQSQPQVFPSGAATKTLAPGCSEPTKTA